MGFSPVSSPGWVVRGGGAGSSPMLMPWTCVLSVAGSDGSTGSNAQSLPVSAPWRCSARWRSPPLSWLPCAPPRKTFLDATPRVSTLMDEGLASGRESMWWLLLWWTQLCRAWIEADFTFAPCLFLTAPTALVDASFGVVSVRRLLVWILWMRANICAE